MDFLYYTKLGMVGVQRKEYGDLVNSVMGDRVYRECWLMKQLDIGIWVIEGRPQWTSDGQLVSRQKWTVHQHLGVIFSLQSRGFWVASTESLTGTANLLTYLSTWLDKDSHSGLDVRPNPQTEFGVTTEKDWVRLRRLPAVKRPLYVLSVRLQLTSGEDAWRAAFARLRPR